MFMWRTSNFKYTFGRRDKRAGCKSSVLTTIYTTAIIFLSPASPRFPRRRFTFLRLRLRFSGPLSRSHILLLKCSPCAANLPLCCWRKWFMWARRACLHQKVTSPLATQFCSPPVLPFQRLAIVVFAKMCNKLVFWFCALPGRLQKKFVAISCMCEKFYRPLNGVFLLNFPFIQWAEKISLAEQRQLS